MNYLSLDIGLRRTGLAFAESAVGVPLALDTLHHTSVEKLSEQVGVVIQERSIDELVVGLPLLPSGDEGKQSQLVRAIAEKLEKWGIPLSFIDERYTTPSSGENDRDASAAIAILEIKLNRC